MNSMMEHSAYFGIVISLLTYQAGVMLKKRFPFALLNPLLLSIVCTILTLAAGHITYQTYLSSASVLSWLLTPATICLAIPLYEQLELLRKHPAALLAGICSGVVTSFVCVLSLSWLFHLTHIQYVTLLPKSITTAIGIGLSEELGGYPTLTVTIIIITGIIGNIFAETACRIFGIRHPIAKGVAIGSSSHAMGTAKAIEMGKIEGAVSSLSLVVSGLLTVLSSMLAAKCL